MAQIDALGPGQVFERLHRLLVRHRHVFGPAAVAQERVLRPDARVIQPRREIEYTGAIWPLSSWQK
jgi:hypothetical protein